MDQLQHFLDVAYDVRWIIVAIVVLTLGVLYADALGTLGRAVQANRELEAENASLRRRLFLKKTADPDPGRRAAPDPRRAPVVALRPREEVRRG